MPDSTEDLSAIQARVDAATPGPWSVEYENDDDYEAGIRDGDYPNAFNGPENITARSANVSSPWREEHGHHVSEINLLTTADAEFIAHARTDVPALLEELTRAQAAIAAALDYIDDNRIPTAWDDDWVHGYEVRDLLAVAHLPHTLDAAKAEARRDGRAEIVAEVNDRLSAPIRPYADPNFAFVPEREFIRDAYGDSLVDDLEAILAPSTTPTEGATP